MPDHSFSNMLWYAPIPSKYNIFNKAHPKGVVAVHCNHGKGRTGTCIIAFMLFVREWVDADKALKFYNSRRFVSKSYGVDQPCQRRLLGYM